jgi:hypothetical protein
LNWRDEALLNPGPTTSLAEYFTKGGLPLILREIDYHDEWCELHRPLLDQQFDVKLLAKVPSVFADVPSCTLHTYSSWTTRYFLVQGIKKSPAIN